MLVTVLQWLFLSLITGATVGTGVSFFLLALFAIADQSLSQPIYWQMLLLPLGGLANGLILYYGYRLNRSPYKDNLFAAVFEQRGRMPFKTFWIKPLATLITLGSGGSAGKEGPCSHLGAVIASGFGKLLHVNPELRKRLVACGVSAGFASVFGTPLAGAIYGVEVLAIGRIRHDFLLPAIIAGVVSFSVSQFWGVPYENYTLNFLHTFSLWLFIKLIFLGLICGFAARCYVDWVQLMRAAFAYLKRRLHLWPPLAPLIGGLLLALLILVIPGDYFGLSLPLMDQALAGQPMPYWGFAIKALLVAITLGSGFYGGVVTPQFVIGALAGNAFAHFFGLDPALGAAIGLCSVLASASNTPIAAILMGVELFGGQSLLYVAGASVSAYLLIGHRSIYPSQRLAFSKSSWMEARPHDLPIGQEKLHLSYALLRWWHQQRNKH